MHRLISLGILGLCLTRLCLAQEAPSAQGNTAAHSVVIRARTLIDGTSAQPRATRKYW